MKTAPKSIGRSGLALGYFYRRAALCCRFLVRRFVVFVVSSFVVSSLYRLLAFVGILGPTGSHRRANGSFWMPFWTKGDARQDGKQSNKSKM